MNKDLRKRIDETATIEAIKDTSKGGDREDYFISAMADHENGFREGFIKGVEWMFKECGDMTVLKDMNKLWEE